MISKILIVNRGEIACRIIRTCRAMGIATVAVFSDADAEALHTQLADEAIHIGEAPASASYLNVERLLEVAKTTGVDAIHPGYGFLAENASFAQAVIDAGFIWIGPKPETIAAMGDKRQAKLLLEDVVPVVPGYSGEDQSDDTLIQAADTIGYPIMVKAAAGGGGKGMRQVNAKEALPEALAAARREAKNAFGDDTLILEHVVENPRHIEVQIVGDTQGRVIALGERECSIQRRHQKIIEETPSTALNDAMRTEMLAAAVRIGKKLGYIGAGTIEFLVGDGDKFYFMEMNTRLQVEHPVTEMVYGVDLVRWQILIAEGYSIDSISPTPPLPHGHAIEARIYAEEPENGFLPSTGNVLHWHLPAGDNTVRIDSGVQAGDIISTHYDPMIAKVIAYSPFSREEAIRKLANTLRQVQLFGLQHNIDFLQRVLLHPKHLAGDISTRFL
ncbi:MAG: ATP-grasp domain-containing protein, partial [Chloroflexi bacterium]